MGTGSRSQETKSDNSRKPTFAVPVIGLAEAGAGKVLKTELRTTFGAE